MKFQTLTIVCLVHCCTLIKAKNLQPLSDFKPDFANSFDGNPKSFNVSSTVLLVNDIEKYKVEHPEVVIQEIPRSPVQSRYGIQYTLGNSGEGNLVAFGYDAVSFGGPTDVVLTLNYPSNGGQGAIVSFVVINVNQSNDLGYAYVAAGGIGQRYINIIVEAKSTTYFQYQAYIFGY